MDYCKIHNGFTFARNKIEDAAPSEAGIYIFWSGLYCVYVGQAKNLKDRLLTHWKRSHNQDLRIWINSLGSKLCISFELVSGDLSRAEQAYIDRYQPHLNKINARVR